jgi:hypothetical protein
MTNTDTKTRIRERMAATGEPYTVAQRATATSDPAVAYICWEATPGGSVIELRGVFVAPAGEWARLDEGDQEAVLLPAILAELAEVFEIPRATAEHLMYDASLGHEALDAAAWELEFIERYGAHYKPRVTVITIDRKAIQAWHQANEDEIARLVQERIAAAQ